MNKNTVSALLTTLTVTSLMVLSSSTLAVENERLRCPSEQREFNTFVKNLRTSKDKLKILQGWSEELYPLKSLFTSEQNSIFCALTIVIKKENKFEPEIRINAILVLRGIGTGAEEAMPELKTILNDHNDNYEIRRNSVLAIKGINAGLAVTELIKILENSNENNNYVVIETASALASITERLQLPENKGNKSKAVKALIDLLNKNPNGEVRRSAAEALGIIKSDDPRVIEILNDALEDPSFSVRSAAADALGNFGNTTNKKIIDNLQNTIPNINKLFSDLNFTPRQKAAYALSQIEVSDEKNQEIVTGKLTTEILKTTNENLSINAAIALGKLGTSQPTPVKTIKILETLHTTLQKDTSKDKNISENAAESISKIAGSLEGKLEANKGQQGYQNSLDKSIEVLENILKEDYFQSLKDYPLDRLAIKQDIEKHLNLLKTKKSLVDSIKETWQKSDFSIRLTIVLSIIFILANIVVLFIFWIRPIWLLRSDDRYWKALSESKIESKIPGMIGEIIQTIVMIIGCTILALRYHPRVLDAWVAKNIKSVRRVFEKKDSVQKCEVYIPIPVILNDETISELTAKDLRSQFNKHLLIWGEGGSGKTSLAFQIAKWAMSDDENEWICKNHQMLPVLIEEDIEVEAARGKDPFIAMIQGQLNDELGSDTEPISEELLEHLLRKQRILVIVDHLSEMSEQTREFIHPEMSDCPVNALVVTSRIKEKLGGVNKTTITPLLVEGNRLSSFMDAYLIKLDNARSLFTDSQFFEACKNLSNIVGQSKITVLLAKLYADQLIAAKRNLIGDIKPEDVPDNIPDLMLRYLNLLNEKVPEAQNKLKNPTVHRDVQVLAWECLKTNYQPKTTKREDAITAIGNNEGEIHLDYLEKRLHLIRTISPAEDKIRFTLDPLVEYLAALYLCSLYRNDENQWSELLNHMDNISISQGFLIALRDCCSAKGEEYNIPSFVLEKLLEATSTMKKAAFP
ncbi:MAG: HEAT repeat domain-containing protein [Microcystis sp.]|jgi:HEAT repeat protein|uniref:HEAT repeat domain-containing protein n=1 Tax=Microcystis sp. TaxID=1127 RepID=UPI0022C1516F|nr:HEAT repeat domain-containing protein [Microcystis sp. LE17-20D]MCZ8067594.1 HEAT repeat domain-containing protein [Microcystis sp. LE17-20D]MCZ8161295.1 HEAT repeat domain-containing protein [Microcystis sp. LE19-196.1B]MCZ8275354.1 HEAT repeat domain-containing protein [Microcystis sp. LE19-4.1E]